VKPLALSFCLLCSCVSVAEPAPQSMGGPFPVAQAAQTHGPGPQSAATSTRPPRYVEPKPYNFDDHAGWQSMFDGETLAGWEGPMDFWHVEDGAIVATDSAGFRSLYLYWAGSDGGVLGDFEFKAEIKLEGEGANSGVQFRAHLLGKTEKEHSEWESFGYQADLDYANEQTGALIECCAGPRRGPAPRPFRASAGMYIAAASAPEIRPTLIGMIGEPAQLKETINVGEWNQLHIIARGHTLSYFLNGQLMSMVVDNDPLRYISHGRLAIQLEGGGDRKVSYRNLWLKTDDKDN